MTVLEPRRLLVALLLLGAATIVSNAAADSVYLKNGRVIHTARARVDHDRVVFTLYGSEQSIPLSVVERVIDDDHVGPAPIGRIPPSPVGSTPPSPTGGSRPSLIGRTSPNPTGVRLPPALARGRVRNVARGPQPIPLPQGIAGLIGPESLGALSGLLGSDPGAIAGLLGGIGAEIDGIKQVLPVLPRLIAAFQQPAQSKDGARAMLDELLGALADLGVSRADIMVRATEYGIPGEWLSTYWSE